jgi:hypothetical protein
METNGNETLSQTVQRIEEDVIKIRERIGHVTVRLDPKDIEALARALGSPAAPPADEALIAKFESLKR